MPKLRSAVATLVIIGSFFGVTSPASASSQTGLVTWIAGDNSGPYSFSLSGMRTAKPACATEDAWVIVAPTSDNAKAMLAIVLSANGMGKAIQAVGTGTCDPTSPNREKISYLALLD